MLSKVARANAKRKHSPVGDCAKSQWESPHRKADFNSGNSGHGEETHTTSISASQRGEYTPYAISTHPSASNAFSTAEYRARPFLIVDNEVRKKLAPARRTRNSKCGLRAA
jgi:hypothetical protein